MLYLCGEYGLPFCGGTEVTLLWGNLGWMGDWMPKLGEVMEASRCGASTRSVHGYGYTYNPTKKSSRQIL